MIKFLEADASKLRMETWMEGQKGN